MLSSFCHVANVAAEGLAIDQKTSSLPRVRRTIRGFTENLSFGKVCFEIQGYSSR